MSLTEWAKDGVPDVVDEEREVHALVLGGAACVWDDLRQVPDGWADVVLAVNDIGSHYPGVLHHWCSLHPEKFPAWEATRRALGHPGDWQKWGRNRAAGVDVGPVDHTIDHWGGSSAGLAVRVALEQLSATHVVLAGCPQTQTPHYHNNREWEHWDVYWADWLRLAGDGRLVRVTSLSGRTRDLLGAPDFLREDA